MANSKDITKFLQDVSVIREFDINFPTTNFSSDAKKKLDIFVKGEVTELSDKYATLESPEKEYLESIKNFYGVSKEKLPLDTPLKQLFNEKKIKTRVYYGLHMADIDYFGELLNFDINDFAKFRNLGSKSTKEIQKLVSEAGYSLGMNLGYVRPDKRE